MATQNVSKWGYARVTGQSSHAAARGASTGQALTNPSGDVGVSFAYQATSSGRGLAYAIYRSFLYFDTSGITGTVTAASVNVTGVTNGGSKAILVPSDAFSGDGSTNLAGSEFGSVSFNTNYHSSISSWSTSGNNVLTLNSTALSDIQNNDFFICAIIQYDNDYSNVDIGGRGGTINFGIAWGTTPYLDYTETATGVGIDSFNDITKTNISTIDNVAFGNIAELSGVS